MKDVDAVASNRSSNPALHQLLAPRLSRRQVVQGGLVAAGLALLGRSLPGLAPGHVEAQSSLLGFTGVPVSTADTVTVPTGYTVQVLYAWGDPIADGPVFTPDASSSAEAQALQAGMHHDGMHFFPLPPGSQNSTRGLLAINHEYTDDGLLHVGGMEPWTAEKVMKSQAAHGVSIIEVMLSGDQWTVVRPCTGRVVDPDRYLGQCAQSG